MVGADKCTVTRVLIPRSWRGSIRKSASELHSMVMSKQKFWAQTKVGGSLVSIRHLSIEERTKILLQEKERTNLTRVKDSAESDQLAIQDSMKMLLTPIHVRVIESEELSTVGVSVGSGG